MKERLLEMIKAPWAIPAAVGVVSFSAGAGIGFYFGRRGPIHETIHVIRTPHDMDAKVEFEASAEDLARVKEKQIDEELERTGLPGGRKRPDPKDLVVDEEINAQIREYVENGGTMQDFMELHLNSGKTKPPDEEEVDDDDAMVNIFTSNAKSVDTWDFDEEVKNRNPDEPYVLHSDEYFNDEMGFSQTTLTFYEGDDILTDSDDTPIYGYHAAVGPMLFGHGSEDPNTFYVRNEKLKAEYEILRDPGHFSEIILGIEADHEEEKELRHSYNKLRKFRPDD